MKADTGVKLATKSAANKEKANENYRRLKQSHNNDANTLEAEQCTHVPVTAEIGDELRVPRETPDNVQPEETDDDTVIDETKDDTNADALDGGWGWFIVFGTFLIHMITVYGESDQKSTFCSSINRSSKDDVTSLPVTADNGDELCEPSEKPDNAQPEEADDDKVIAETKDDTRTDALDGGWGWFVVFGAFLINMIMDGFRRSNGLLYLQLGELYQQSATATSWVPALFSTLIFTMGPVASALCNKFSVRRVVMFGGALSMVGILVSGFSPNLWFLYFNYGIVTGFGHAMAYCPGLIIVGYYFNKRRGLAVGLATSGGSVGSIFFPPLFETMFENYGFTGTLLLMSAITLHFMIAGALFRPFNLQQKLAKLSKAKSKERPQFACQNSKHLTDGAKAEEQTLEKDDAKHFTPSGNNTKYLATRRRSSVIIRKLSEVIEHNSLETKNVEKKPLLELALFRNYAFATICVQGLMTKISFSVTFFFLPALAESKGLTKLQGAYMISILGICDSVSRILMSVLLDLKPVKKYRLVIYNTIIMMFGVVSVVIPMMQTFSQFAVVCAVYGSLAGIYVSQKSVILVDILGVEKLSSAFGLFLMFQGIGTLIGPTIGGLFKDFLDSYEMSFFCGSGGIFLGGVVQATGNIWLYLQRRKTTTTNADNTA